MTVNKISSHEYVQGYTAALRDVESTLWGIQEDLKRYKRKQNVKTYLALVRFMIENRVALREIAGAFIRCSDKTESGFELWWDGRHLE